MIKASLIALTTTLMACATATPARPVAAKASAAKANATTNTPGFDAARAKRLGADAYGMKRYVMALLRRGPNRSSDAALSKKLMRAHLDNITRLAKAGKLVLAGPFLDKGALRGIYVFNVSTVEQARELTKTDPAIKAGALIMELHPWYGSAALQEVNAAHERISAKSI